MTKARTLESRGNVSTLFTGCAQIYHQRWYVRPSGRELQNESRKHSKQQSKTKRREEEI
ncbi:hypothetical protein AALB52_24400 [Lachnospiraceae bacterium 38-14]|uniref:hypothetical protein n=1 Tax=Roseburia sp. 1XD42-69 TaxID=2320088 RepID=UPI0018F4C90C|nr:hypothetical protein [Roseburia sp. 1XD42-69]